MTLYSSLYFFVGQSHVPHLQIISSSEPFPHHLQAKATIISYVNHSNGLLPVCLSLRLLQFCPFSNTRDLSSSDLSQIMMQLGCFNSLPVCITSKDLAITSQSLHDLVSYSLSHLISTPLHALHRAPQV